MRIAALILAGGVLASPAFAQSWQVVADPDAGRDAGLVVGGLRITEGELGMASVEGWVRNDSQTSYATIIMDFGESSVVLGDGQYLTPEGTWETQPEEGYRVVGPLAPGETWPFKGAVLLPGCDLVPDADGILRKSCPRTVTVSNIGPPAAVITPPIPRGMILPPADRPRELRGKEVTIFIFVAANGTVMSDSTRIEPSTGNANFDARLRTQAATWLFEPARRNGAPYAEWYRYKIGL